jgi:hypothetical protein
LQTLVDENPDGSQRVARRNPSVRRNIAEHAALLGIDATHTQETIRTFLR